MAQTICILYYFHLNLEIHVGHFIEHNSHMITRNKTPVYIQSSYKESNFIFSVQIISATSHIGKLFLLVIVVLNRSDFI